MLLDSGLDNAAKYSYSSGGNNSSNYQWVQYTAVGTGASAPAASQTLLVAETARTNSNGGFGPANEYEADAANNLLRARHTNTRVFNFSSASNVSEFGHVPTSSGGPFTTRDLFRQEPQRPQLHAGNHQRSGRRPTPTYSHSDYRAGLAGGRARPFR